MKLEEVFEAWQPLVNAGTIFHQCLPSLCGIQLAPSKNVLLALVLWIWRPWAYWVSDDLCNWGLQGEGFGISTRGNNVNWRRRMSNEELKMKLYSNEDIKTVIFPLVKSFHQSPWMGNKNFDNSIRAWLKSWLFFQKTRLVCLVPFK